MFIVIISYNNLLLLYRDNIRALTTHYITRDIISRELSALWGFPHAMFDIFTYHILLRNTGITDSGENQHIMNVLLELASIWWGLTFSLLSVCPAVILRIWVSVKSRARATENQSEVDRREDNSSRLWPLTRAAPVRSLLRSAVPVTHYIKSTRYLH